jgi:hypothetical protein
MEKSKITIKQVVNKFVREMQKVDLKSENKKLNPTKKM